MLDSWNIVSVLYCWRYSCYPGNSYVETNNLPQQQRWNKKIKYVKILVAISQHGLSDSGLRVKANQVKIPISHLLCCEKNGPISSQSNLVGTPAHLILVEDWDILIFHTSIITTSLKSQSSMILTWKIQIQIHRSHAYTYRRSPICSKFQKAIDIGLYHIIFPTLYIAVQLVCLVWKMPLDFVSKQHHDVYPSIDPKSTLRGVADGKVIVLTGAGKGIGEVF